MMFIVIFVPIIHEALQKHEYSWVWEIEFLFKITRFSIVDTSSFPTLGYRFITHVINNNLGNRIWPSLVHHFITQVMIYNLGYDLKPTVGNELLIN